MYLLGLTPCALNGLLHHGIQVQSQKSKCVFRRCVWDNDHHVLSCGGVIIPTHCSHHVFRTIHPYHPSESFATQIPKMCCAADWMWYASIFSWSSAAIAWIAFKHSVPPTPFRNRRCPRKKVCHRPTAPPCVRKQQLQAGRCVDAYLDDVYLVVPPQQGPDTAFHLFAQPVCGTTPRTRRCKNFPENSKASPLRASKTPCYNAYQQSKTCKPNGSSFCSGPSERRPRRRKGAMKKKIVCAPLRAFSAPMFFAFSRPNSLSLLFEPTTQPSPSPPAMRDLAPPPHPSPPVLSNYINAACWVSCASHLSWRLPAVFSRSAIIGRYEPKNNQRVLLPTVLCSLQCCSTDPHGLRLIVCNFETVRVVRSSKHEWLIFVLFACQVTTCKPAQVISNCAEPSGMNQGQTLI